MVPSGGEGAGGRRKLAEQEPAGRKYKPKKSGKIPAKGNRSSVDSQLKKWVAHVMQVIFKDLQTTQIIMQFCLGKIKEPYFKD